jgi:chromosomal replication initiation ATPase DnaA
MGTPIRFTVDKKYCWRYVGREKFAKLLSEFRLVQEESKYKRLWVYGTRGYGKSHLLAALVCYLTALDERVIYIPDCGSCIEDPVQHLQTAMLFAWADKTTQDKILTLKTEDKIKEFLNEQQDVVFIVDQMNKLSEAKTGSEAKAELLALITSLISSRKAVLSTSANYQEFLNRQNEQNNDRTMRVYGGLTPVCLSRLIVILLLTVI